MQPPTLQELVIRVADGPTNEGQTAFTDALVTATVFVRLLGAEAA